MIFFAAAAANQNDLVAQEAKNVGSENVRLINGGVEFEGDLACAYRFCLYSRIATRMLIALAHDENVFHADDLYDSSMQIPWETWLDPTKTFTVTITTMHCDWLKNSTFGAIRLKDAIVDRMRECYEGERPSVDFENPDVTFHIHIEGEHVTWYLDFSGKSMHKRGYRESDTGAILKENLAAAVLYRSDWYRTVLDDSPAMLVDPFCGAGTIPIEAALIATDTAPGLIDTGRFAFLKLEMHDVDLWEEILDEAYARQTEGSKRNVRFLAWDNDPEALSIAEGHARKAGVGAYITFEQKDFNSLTLDDIPSGNHYVVTDPPYGIRMEGGDSTQRLYITMGRQFNSLFLGWRVSILCGDKELLSFVDMKPDRTNSLFNGPLDCQLAHYYVFTAEERQAMMEKSLQKKRERLEQPLSPGAEMAYNRLKKNLVKIKPLMLAQGVTSYRIYDADMPEYSAAIDLYEGKFIHLQEYAPPATIDPDAAIFRLQELIDATERATGIDRDVIFVKQRREQKGTDQYEKQGATGKFYIMRENGLMFLVNFQDYLDTGIFLDHRPVRKMIMEMAKGKRFLNLFCYTGTATVHAATGGAVSTISVDASSTYLDWAIKNMQMNGFEGMNHFFYKSDCIDWLKETRDTFDLIFCDPPTFSNSKMRSMFDIDRDQGRLIHSAMRHLTTEGVMIFSTNFRKFSLDPELEEDYYFENITAQTIGDDFERDQKIHYCYLVRHKRAIVKMPKKEIQAKPPAKRIVRKRD
jgi:23S rRNA (guanine2445-N2)-methyltransferase / 23S rRNA (guanine2069-N7)-methyltransferase